ncbi:MAG TPA: hypothetical protein VFZ71_02580 [Pyrinomonadaceae bacterium]
MQQLPSTPHLSISVIVMTADTIGVTTGVTTGDGHERSDGHESCGMAGVSIERFMPSGTTQMAERIHG